MAKILFFSDVHGVPPAMEKLLFQVEKLQPDHLVLLGDALYHGPRNGVPADYDTLLTAEFLNRHRTQTQAVRGNCDSEVDQMMLEFPMMADYSELWCGKFRFFLTHGHRWNGANLPPLASGTVLVHGHTHIPECRKLDCGITVFNPGSIALPKGGWPPSFGWFEGSSLTVLGLDDGRRLL